MLAMPIMQSGRSAWLRLEAALVAGGAVLSLPVSASSSAESSAAAAAARPLECFSQLVYPGPDGRLIYVSDELGNRIPDFSQVGYLTGTVEPPDVPVKATVEPGPGDAGARIQEAIDAVSQLPPDADGFRGAVLVRAGIYPIAGHLELRASGVVLRGDGRNELAGTVLVATGTEQRTLVQVKGSGSRQKLAGTEHSMVDDYVPVGTTTFQLDGTDGLNVGDQIIAHRPSTAEWIHDIGMDLLDNPWLPGSKDLNFDRVITAIEGSQVTVDAPLTNAFEQRYGGGDVYAYGWPGRIERVGVEHIKGRSEFADPTDEAHSWTFIDLAAVQNGWVRDVTAQHFAYSAVFITRTAKWVTVSDAESIDPVSVVTGGRRYSFNIEGQLSLVRNARTSQGRHGFVLGSVVPGPNVFVDGLAEQALSDTGPHHRWSNGSLFDNIVVQGHAINIRNRGNLGTGHGWAGANTAVWNSTADSMNIERPPTAQNWSIGSTTPQPQGDGYWDSLNCPVTPRSLYYAQLQDRLTGASTARR
jgi:hypothetical protein